MYRFHLFYPHWNRDVLKPKRRAENDKRIEPGNIDDLSASARKRLAEYWPEYWRVLSTYGTFGQKLDTENISKLKIFNYTDSGELKVDSTSYTQGCVKNCYFMATLKTLSHTPGAQKCLRNCFDKMTDDDLRFKNEKSVEERLNKKLTVGFYRIDFDDMCINTLKYLGTRAKGRGGEGMETKPLAQKVYL